MTTYLVKRLLLMVPTAVTAADGVPAGLDKALHPFFNKLFLRLPDAKKKEGEITKYEVRINTKEDEGRGTKTES